MNSRESSPPPLSDDSAVGSTASERWQSQQKQAPPADNQKSQQPSHGTPVRAKTKEPDPLTIVTEDELIEVANAMRFNNTTLTSRSIRTHLSCFDDLNMQRYERRRPDYLVNFVSKGINKCPSSIQRLTSIIWPDTYRKMVLGLAKLDAHLINTELIEKPIDWMIERGLTVVPSCQRCNSEMILNYEDDAVQWICQKTQACLNLVCPILRPRFFREYEYIGLIQILFSMYFWSTCTQLEFVSGRLNLERQILYGIWKRIQNVCRTALEKSNPQVCLSNRLMNQDESAPSMPVDLISIKFNGNYIVCAKHPDSNVVRLGLCIRGVSKYSFVELTESWFVEGAEIRVCEEKFLSLGAKRCDLNVVLVTRSEMITRNGLFDRNAAFGYLICQLTHALKDFDSSSITTETLKLILAEIQWRELYGTTPYDAFKNIIKHTALYEESSGHFSELATGYENEKIKKFGDMFETDSMFAEKYFYATVEPIDSRGEVIRIFGQPENFDKPPVSVARFFCHICNNSYESFYFSMHIIEHIENNRKENEEKDYNKRGLIVCKHCFKPYTREDISTHSGLFRTHLQRIKFSCRICCIKLQDRDNFLQHMRRQHFEHEVPYRCPSCRFASSFQRELFIHFQEEHRTSFILMCPFCLRSFTVRKPEELNVAQMHKVSQKVYEHILEHYVIANIYSCTNCCLSFLSKEKLRQHMIDAHNPLEIHPEEEVKLQPFIVSKDEEPACVQALPMELFIANKQPNLAINESRQASICSNGLNDGLQPTPPTNRLIDQTLSSADHQSVNGVDDDDYQTANEDDLVLTQRDPELATKFLAGGRPDLHVSSFKSKAKPCDELTSEKIIEYMSKLRRADGVIPNQSVILNPEGNPIKCVECHEYLSTDHYVAAITCKVCQYITHCPQAATNHQTTEHENSAPIRMTTN